MQKQASCSNVCFQRFVEWTHKKYVYTSVAFLLLFLQVRKYKRFIAIAGAQTS